MTNRTLAMERICKFANGRESSCACASKPERYFCEETRLVLEDVERLLKFSMVEARDAD